MTLQFADTVKLLVVDDDADTRELLSLFFSSRGYIVVTAQTGREALDAIELDRDFDIVILDVFIPRVGGLEVLREIQQQNPRPSVILLTGLADSEIAHDALRLGAFDYILKPFDLGQVEASVVACLSHAEFQRQSWWKRYVLRPAA